MKKLFSLVLSLVLLLAVPAGCGQSEAGSAPAGPAGSAGSQQASPGAKTVLKFAIWGNDARKTEFKELSKPFEDENNCEIEIMLIPFDEFMQKISIQLASNTAPDVLWLAEKMVPQFIASGKLVDLAPAIKDDADYDFDDFYDTAWDLFKRGDSIYGVPFTFGPRLVYYNKTMFEEKGVKTPTELYNEGKWTIDEFFKTAKELTDSSKGVYGLKMSGATEPTAYMNSIYDLVLANGANYFNDDMTEFTLDTPEGIRSVQQYYDALFVDQSCVKPGDQTQFETGKIGMARDVFSYANNLRGKVDFEWDIVCQPDGPDKNAKQVTGYANYSATVGKNQELAVEYVKYMTSKDIMLKVVGGFPGCRESVLSSDVFLNQPDGQPSPESVKLAFISPIESPGLLSLPAHENYQKIDVEVNKIFELMFAKELTPEQAVKEMKAKVDPLLKK